MNANEIKERNIGKWPHLCVDSDCGDINPSFLCVLLEMQMFLCALFKQHDNCTHHEAMSKLGK